MKILNKNGQNAIEYLLLLALVVGIVLVAFRKHMPTIYSSANVYFNSATNAIVGGAPRCGDGVCDAPYEIDSECSADCAL